MSPSTAIPATRRTHAAPRGADHRGEYHHAGTAEKLRSVYQQLGSRLQVSKLDTELTGLVAVVVMVVGLSEMWFGRAA